MAALRDRVLRVFTQARQVTEGQGYTEYLILIALIAIAAYAAVQLLGQNVSTAMSTVGGSV